MASRFRWEHASDPVGELLLGDAGLGHGENLLDLAVGAGEALRLGERDVGGDSAAGALGGAEGEGADEGELLATELVHHRDLIADLEPALLDGRDVERDLVVGLGPATLLQVVERQLGIRHPALDERRVGPARRRWAGRRRRGSGWCCRSRS